MAPDDEDAEDVPSSSAHVAIPALLCVTHLPVAMLVSTHLLCRLAM